MYDLRFAGGFYLINGIPIGSKVSDVSAWFRVNQPTVNGIVTGCCQLARNPDFDHVKIVPAPIGWRAKPGCTGTQNKSRAVR